MCVCVHAGQRVCLQEGKHKYTDYVIHPFIHSKYLLSTFYVLGTLWLREKEPGSWRELTSISPYLSGLPYQFRFLWSLCWSKQPNILIDHSFPSTILPFGFHNKKALVFLHVQVTREDCIVKYLREKTLGPDEQAWVLAHLPAGAICY